MKKRYCSGLLTLLFILLPFCGRSQGSGIIASVNEGCAPLSVTFSYNSNDAVNYQWDFENGTSSILKSPTVLFDNPGEYNVRLIITTQDAMIDTVYLPEPIKIFDKPLPDFEIQMDNICDGNEVSFINKSIGATLFIWDFGDGNISNQVNPVHTYERGGVYRVTLIIQNEKGCTASMLLSDPIIINDVEIIDFTVDDSIVCINNPAIQFFGPDNFISYNWDFGDGSNSSEKDPIHSFTNNGIFDIGLTISDANGCSRNISKEQFIEVLEQPEFKAILKDTLICAGSPMVFSFEGYSGTKVNWSFSDGFSSSQRTIVKQFDTPDSYLVTLTKEPPNGCTVVEEATINVVNSEKISYTISNNEGCVPFEVEFENTTPDAVGFEWTIEGESFSGKKIKYSFQQEGTYPITVKTVHSSGCEGMIIVENAIVVHSSENEIKSSINSGCVPIEATLSLSNANVSNILWDLGNGTTSSEAVAKVIYDKPGNYKINASFDNVNGCRETIELDNPIVVSDTLINLKTPDPTYTCTSLEVFFNGEVGNDFYEWDFGDGVLSNLENPTHRYDQPGNYFVSLVTNNKYGCRTTIPVYNNIVVEKVNPDFDFQITDIKDCPSFKVEFQNLSQDVDRVHWDFGDGQTTTALNPIHEYNLTAQFTVSLTVWNPNGCSNTKTRSVSAPWELCNLEPGGVGDPINIKVKPRHEMKACKTPFEVEFQNPRPSALSWHWDFGDGNTSDSKDPNYIYKTPGSYEVDLIAKLSDGTFDTLNGYAIIQIEPSILDFDYDIRSICDGAEASFSNKSIDMVDWEWDFGNGEKSTSSDPKVLYTEKGLYQVKLSGTNKNGCESRIVKNILVGNPYQNFNYPQDVCIGEPLNFIHNVTGYERYFWDFGDGTTGAGMVGVHQYSSPGSYSIILSAEDHNGCLENFSLPHDVVVNNPKAEFEVIGKTFGCNNLEVSFKNTSQGADSWIWDFGNGETSNQKDPVVSFQGGVYTVSLTALKNGCSDTKTIMDLILVENLAPAFTYEQDQICFPSTFKFYNQSENAIAWYWDFGDGTISTEENPVHTYTEIPEKFVKLQISSTSGCLSTTTKKIANFHKTSFNAENNIGCIPLKVIFQDESSSSTSWHWDFGDGSSSTLQNPDHIYENRGEYDVTLVTQSQSGCYDTLKKENFVISGNVVSKFVVGVNELVCAPYRVDFKNQSQGATKFFWDFGNGSFSTNANPSHVYTSAGSFNVSLVATNDIGCSDTLIVTNLINISSPEAKFSVSSDNLCGLDTIQFNDLSESATQWEWYFGDGNTSSVQNPKHYYEEPGEYIVSLMAMNERGCEQLVKSDTIKIFNEVEANFEILQTNTCFPVTIQTKNISKSDATSAFLWNFGDGRSSTDYSPQITYDRPGEYLLSLTVTNGIRCTDSKNISVWVDDPDSVDHFDPPVERISVEDDNIIELTMSPHFNSDVKYCIIHRKSPVDENFRIIDTLTSNSQLHFIDRDVEPRLYPYTYRIQAFTECNNLADLDEFQSYSSINLTVDPGELSNSLIWTGYSGHTFSHYRVLRKKDGEDWIEISQIPENQNEFIDSLTGCSGEYLYQVCAMNLDGTQYHSFSNSAGPVSMNTRTLAPEVEIIRTSVVNNSAVYTEWKISNNDAMNVAAYLVWRGNQDRGYELIASVPSDITNYYDENVDIGNESYEYQISTLSDCDLESFKSNIGTSILLQKDRDDRLFWTPYKGWKEGVGKYLIQRKNEFGIWETIDEVSSDQLDYILDSDN